MQEPIKQLTPEADAELLKCFEKHNDCFLSALQSLARRVLPEVDDAVRRNEGLEVYEQSRAEITVAYELKEYAIAMLDPDISRAVAKLPDYADLDAFLESIMKDTGHKVRRNRFMDFLRDEASKQLANDPPPPGLGLEEDAASRWIESQACARFEALGRESVRALVAYDIKVAYMEWWKRQEKGNPLAAPTKARSDKKAAKMEKMLGRLPCTNRANQTICRADWQREVKLLFDIPESTFDKYLGELRKTAPPGFIEKPKNKFRRIPLQHSEEK